MIQPTLKARQRNWLRWASWTWLLSCVATGIYFLASGPKSMETSTALVSTRLECPELSMPTEVSGADLPPGVAVRPIEQLKIGDRVLAYNPLIDDVDRAEEELLPDEWRMLRLAIHKDDGYQLDIVLLRPVEWLAAYEAEVGGQVELDIPEMNAYGMAQVLAIEPCPVITEGEGSVVTGTYRHTSGDVINVGVSGLADPIGTTADHPFWSEDRQQFVPAESLQLGEQLRSQSGQLSLVTSITRRGPPEPVYNLEVYGENVYYVSHQGILVHNYPSGSTSRGTGTKAIVLGEGMGAIKVAAKNLQTTGVNAKWYQAWGKNFPSGRPMTTAELNAALARNERWIRSKIAQGYKLYDIGIDPARSARSPFYALEQKIIRELGATTTKIARP